MSLKNRTRWVLITAGLTPGPMRDAGERVAVQARGLYEFEQIVLVTQDNLREMCPLIYDKYEDRMNVNSKGFGYYAWKTEVVSRVLEGKLGKCDGIVWVDGGCEVNVNSISRHVFSLIVNSASRHGGWFYELNTPEEQYTKRDLAIRFSEAVKSRPKTQVQANFFLLHGEEGKALAKKWRDLALERIENIDFSRSALGESEGFVEHRNDQSLLSLLVKSSHFPISRFVPPARPQSVFGKIKGFVSPVWVARNRSGNSIFNAIGEQSD